MTVGPHLTREEISAAVEGILAHDDQRAADAHLAGCSRCRTLLDEVTAVRAVVRDAGEHSPPMPDAVADRLLAAISAEAEARRTTEATVTPIAAINGHGSRAGRSRGRRSGRRRPSRVLQALSAAAAVTLLVGGGTFTYQQIAGDDRSATAKDTPASTRMEPKKQEKNSAEVQASAYEIDGAPKLTSSGFVPQVARAVQPASTGPNPFKGPSKQSALSDRCARYVVRDSGGRGSVLDEAAATFEKSPARLVITTSSRPEAVEAYVVTGCPASGKVAFHRIVPLTR